MLRTAGWLALPGRTWSAGFDGGISPPVQFVAAQLLGGWVPTEAGLPPASHAQLTGHAILAHFGRPAKAEPEFACRIMAGRTRRTPPTSSRSRGPAATRSSNKTWRPARLRQRGTQGTVKCGGVGARQRVPLHGRQRSADWDNEGPPIAPLHGRLANRRANLDQSVAAALRELSRPPPPARIAVLALQFRCRPDRIENGGQA